MPKTMKPEDIDKQFQQLEARAAKLGLSVEEVIEQRLMELQESQPEVFAQLMQKVSASSLRAVHSVRRVSDKLAELESEARKENATAILAATPDMRDNLDAMLDYFAAFVLAADRSRTPS